MQYTMPVMFGFFSLSFQAGLSIYFVISNTIGIIQGVYTRRVMDREKAKLAEEKQLKGMGMSGSIPDTNDSALPKEKSTKAKDSGDVGTNVNGSTPGQGKKKSKRKKQSGKK